MPLTLSLAVGQSYALTVTARDVGGSVVAGRPTTHVSSNEAVAVVSASGVIAPRSVGAAVITTTVDGISDTTTLTVTGDGTGGAAPGSLAVLSPPVRLSRDVPILADIREALRAAGPSASLATRLARISHRIQVAPTVAGYTTMQEFADVAVGDLTAPQQQAIVDYLRRHAYTITPWATATLAFAPIPATITGNPGGTLGATVTVTDVHGLPVAGVTVAMASSDVTLCSVSPATAVTDYRGIASFTLTSVGFGTSTMTASVGAITTTGTVTTASGTFVETFVRADNATTLGGNYTAHRGTWGVLSNKGYVAVTTGAGDYDNVSRATKSGAISNKVVVSNVVAAVGVTIREAGTGLQHIKLEWGGAGAGQLGLYSRNGALNTETAIGAGGTSPLVNGDVLEIREDGAGNIAGYVNNVLTVGPYTSSIGVGNARCGLSSYNSTAVRFGTWTVS